MLPFGDWSLLEEGEEDKKDTSKNPHLGELGRECRTIRSQNTGIACILGAYGPALPPLTLSIKLIAL